jgi:hypothetical protein
MMVRLSALLLVASCAAAPPQGPDREAVADFIEVRQLENVEQIRRGRNDGWSRVNDYYVIYETGKRSYLVRFARRCSELEDIPVVADTRWDAHTIRARFDTLRGCLIERIYPLNHADLLELESIAGPPARGT